MPESIKEPHDTEWSQTIIDHLAATDDGTASLDALVECIIAQEPHEGTLDRETVVYELVHVCLPALAEHGVINYNERTETIKYRPPPDRER